MPDYRVPERMTTYREAMDAAYKDWMAAARSVPDLWRELKDCEFRIEDRGMELAKKTDVSVAGTRYISRHTPPKTKEQKDAVFALYAADNAYQKAKSDEKHWEWCYRERKAQIDADPEIADQPLEQAGREWLQFIGKRKPPRHWTDQGDEVPF